MAEGSALKIVGEEHSHDACSSAVSMNVISDSTGIEVRKFRGNAAMITLGCAKNQVDSEVMQGVLRSQGFQIISDLSVADVAVVNTCGFLQSSVKESIDCILDVAKYKKSGRLRKLIVAGCLVERYKDDLRKTLPEVDDFVAVDDLLKVGEVADGSMSVLLNNAARPYFLYDDTMPRQLLSRSHTAYIKVAEGCNRPCTFCIIPKLRGAMRSRGIESVLNEVRALGGQGVREINLVAQDLTSYGTDHKEGNLAALLRAIDGTLVGGRRAIDWVRLLYSYPIGIDAELLDTIVGLESVCNYLDLPLQHSSESVLKVMKRPLGKFSPRKIVEFIRAHQPSIHLRTTFIVGFPGETESDIDDLEKFILDGHFTNLGIFTYSKEEGTPSHDLTGHLPEKVKSERRKRLMLAQQKVNSSRLEGLVGQSIEVLVEGTHEDTDLLLTGRSRFQAPDVDGTVIINDVAEGMADIVRPGVIGHVEITEVAGYDLIGKFTRPVSIDA